MTASRVGYFVSVTLPVKRGNRPKLVDGADRAIASAARSLEIRQSACTYYLP